MKYLLKLCILPILYLFFMLVITLSVTLIDNNLLWLKIIAGMACAAVYFYIVFGAMFREGEIALKVRIANDVERKNIIQTGEDRPLKIKEEYKAWKGFAVGLLSCVPLIICIIIHSAYFISTGVDNSWAGGVAKLLYSVVFIFFRFGEQDLSAYFSLIYIPVILICSGVSYVLGARKIQRQQDKLNEIERSIYGEKGNKQSVYPNVKNKGNGNK